MTASALPFDARQFFDVFARYNTAVWPAQIGLELAGLAAVLLAIRSHETSGRAVAAILGGLWLWMGGVYHLLFFRSINPAAGPFGALFIAEGVLLLVVGAVHRRLVFAWTPTPSGVLGAVLVVYALVIYPALSYALGHRYPAAPTFGLPCPTTILTLGVLAWADARRSWVWLTIPLLWAAVGVSAALQLGMWEDLGLGMAGVLVLAAALQKRSQRKRGDAGWRGEERRVRGLLPSAVPPPVSASDQANAGRSSRRTSPAAR